MPLHSVSSRLHPGRVAEATYERSQGQGLPVASISTNFRGVQLMSSTQTHTLTKGTRHPNCWPLGEDAQETASGSHVSKLGCLATLQLGTPAFISTRRGGPRRQLSHVFKHLARTQCSTGTHCCLRLEH